MKRKLSKIKRMTAVLLAAVVFISTAKVGFAEDAPAAGNCADDVYSDDCGKLGYIPDAGLGTPATYTGIDRTFGYIYYLYPDGSFFQGQVHSGNWNPCSTEPSIICDCINFQKSIQCDGFAKKVYYETHGRSLSAMTYQEMNLTVESTQALFKRNNTSPEAIYLRVNTKTDLDTKGEHSIIIVFSSESEVIVYHANYGGPCKVNYEGYSWENFVDAFPHLYYYSY